MARAAIAAGADGILVEVHDHPEKALSDGQQSLYPAQFATMMQELEQLAPIVGRRLPRGVAVDSRQ
jgi:3-deoxy-7-phosphoheptulonate synthase